MLQIPINTDQKAEITFSVNVESVSMSLHLMWNTRDGHWYGNFESSNGINNGVRFVVNSPLLGAKRRCLKSGDFVILQTITGQELELDFDTLGNGFSFYYFTDSEIKSLKEALTSMEVEE